MKFVAAYFHMTRGTSDDVGAWREAWREVAREPLVPLAARQLRDPVKSRGVGHLCE